MFNCFKNEVIPWGVGGVLFPFDAKTPYIQIALILFKEKNVLLVVFLFFLPLPWKSTWASFGAIFSVYV